MEDLGVLANHRDLVGKRPLLYLLKVLVWAAALLCGIYLFLQASGAALQSAGALLAALMMAHGVELQHQALHGSGFNGRRLNRIVGFALGLPLLISFAHYRDRHLHHHRHVGTPDDSEFFQYSKQGNHRVATLVANLLMLAHWVRVARLMLAAVLNRPMGRVYNTRNRSAIRADYLLFAILLAGLLAACAAGACPARLLALVLLAAPLHTLIELPEHLRCNRTACVFENTRSIRSNRFMTWLTNGNNYHVEHHLIPSVIPERLHILHRRLGERLRFRSDSYTGLLVSLLIKQG